MKLSDRIKLAQSERRRKLAELAAVESPSDEQRSEMETLTTEYRQAETQYQAAVIAEGEERSRIEGGDVDAETRERLELRGRTRVGRYVSAAMGGRPIDGAEAEYSAALGIEGGELPLELLAPETRAAPLTDTDGAANQGTWVDRLFAETAAMALGVTFDSVGAGASVYPVVTAGASSAQRGRDEAADDASWTVGATRIEPTPNRVRAVFSTTDAYRLPGLEGALRRDLAAAQAEGVDRAVFLGDDGANENENDIVGLVAAANVVEKTISQANKVKGPQTAALFAELVDGKHAAMMSDLRIVASVGANSLWNSTNVSGASGQPMLLAEFLRNAGLSWRVRGDIETATAQDDWGAFVGRSRGLTGAGVAAIWESAALVRDMYTGAAKGQVALTMQTQWGFALPRPTNFCRIKFAA